MEVKKYKDMEQMKKETFIVMGGDDNCKYGVERQNCIAFKKDHPDAVIPTKAEPGATGYDLTSIEEVIINPGEFKMVSTGLKWQASGWDMSIRPRSGLAAKHGVTVLNAPGSIDSSYRGIIKVILINHSKELFKVEKGMRIAQAVFHKVEDVLIGEVEELTETIRGEGGFGSTGK